MTDEVIILGGPKHGQRIATLDGIALKVAMLEDKVRWRDLQTEDDPWALSVRHLTFPIIRIPLGPERDVRAAIHPDISRDTGYRLLGDLVYATWKKHGHA